MNPLLLLTLLLLPTHTTTKNIIHPRDLAPLAGTKWTGQLTYLDYSTNKKRAIPANIAVSRSATDKFTWYFAYEYPNESQANSRDTIVLSRDGQYLNKGKVLERRKDGKERLSFLTEKTSNDDGEEKTFRYTYLITPSHFSIRKEERKKEEAFIERNRYEFTR